MSENVKIINHFIKRNMVYDSDENVLFIRLKELDIFDMEILNRKDNDLKIQYVLNL